MRNETKKHLRDKAGYTYGLSNVLKYEIDNLRMDTRDCNPIKLRESIQEVNISLKKLLLVVGEIEYILNLEKTEGP